MGDWLSELTQPERHFLKKRFEWRPTWQYPQCFWLKIFHVDIWVWKDFFLCRCFFLFGWGGGRLNRENHAWLFIDFCSIDVYCIDYRWSLTPSGRNEFMV